MKPFAPFIRIKRNDKHGVLPLYYYIKPACREAMKMEGSTMRILQILLFALIIFLIYLGFKYILNPKRKLELAHEQKRYYLLDDPKDVRKNFLLTYKGRLFEGEKYLGTTKNAFEVVSIHIWPHSIPALNGMVREDFLFIEEKILEIYPNAKIYWQEPIGEFMRKTDDQNEPFHE